MTLHDWIYSVYPADAVINGRWGPLHISVILLCAAFIAAICFLRRKDERTHTRVIQVLALCILALELARRGINLSRGASDPLALARILLPRPWCAISCWLVIAAAFAKKKTLYSFAAMNALLNALVFFAYPNVGFNHRVILFENFYSIATHALLLVSSVSMIALGLTDYRMEKKQVLKMLAMLAGVYAYAGAEILLEIEPDPLMFLPGSEVQDFLGVGYAPFLLIYTAFLCVYFSSFFLVQKWLTSRYAKVRHAAA